jgi:prepilin-type N-terminal cleavage/methylation domain-containing protein
VGFEWSAIFCAEMTIRFQTGATEVKKRGFTLIELLVVIAIISLLAAILFPVFATARDKARQAACASNEKQIGLAAMQYVQDYDEGYPWSLMGGTYYLTGPGNPNSLLSPYIKSANVTHCPSEGNGWSVASVDATTYAYNTHFGNYKTGSPSVQTTVYLPELTSPSETIC